MYNFLLTHAGNMRTSILQEVAAVLSRYVTPVVRAWAVAHPAKSRDVLAARPSWGALARGWAAATLRHLPPFFRRGQDLRGDPARRPAPQSATQGVAVRLSVAPDGRSLVAAQEGVDRARAPEGARAEEL